MVRFCPFFIVAPEKKETTTLTQVVVSKTQAVNITLFLSHHQYFYQEFSLFGLDLQGSVILLTDAFDSA